MARPTSYSDEVLNKTKDYVTSCQDVEVQIISGESAKFTAYKQKLTVKLPTIEGLAGFLGIHKDTIYEWEKIHSEFSDVINILRSNQARELINKGLSGDYNPIIAKLLLMKHGYTDKVENEHSGSVAWDVTLNINAGSKNQLHKALGAGISEADTGLNGSVHHNGSGH